MAYYYFDFGEAENRTLDSFMKSLIVQLTAKLPETPKDLYKLYTSSRTSKQDPSTEDLTRVLRTIITKCANPFIVVDALDECSNSEELVQFIEDMRAWRTADVRLLVVSRKHFEGSDALEDLQPDHISIQDEAANNDILTFVRELLKKDLKLRHWPPKVKEEIETALVSKSSGM